VLQSVFAILGGGARKGGVSLFGCQFQNINSVSQKLLTASLMNLDLNIIVLFFEES